MLTVERVSNDTINLVFDNASTYVGNLLQKELLTSSSVSFVGYSKPHPLENRMVVTVTTVDKNPREVVSIAFSRLIEKFYKLREMFSEL